MGASAVAASSNLAKRATNVSLPGDLVQQARELGADVSQACEKGLVEEVAQ